MVAQVGKVELFFLPMTPIERAAVDLLINRLASMDKWQRGFVIDLYHKVHTRLSERQLLKLIELTRKYLPTGWEHHAKAFSIRPSIPKATDPLLGQKKTTIQSPAGTMGTAKRS